MVARGDATPGGRSAERKKEKNKKKGDILYLRAARQSKGKEKGKKEIRKKKKEKNRGKKKKRNKDRAKEKQKEKKGDSLW